MIEHWHVGVKFDRRALARDYVLTFPAGPEAREAADQEREDGAQEVAVWRDEKEVCDDQQ